MDKRSTPSSDASLSVDCDFGVPADMVPLQIWRGGARGTIERANQKMSEYFDRSPEELAGTHWKELIHPEDWPKLRDNYTETRKETATECRLKGGDGTYNWYRIRLIPGEENAGDGHWLGINTRVNQRDPERPPRKQIEEERERLLAQEKAARQEAQAAVHRFRELVGNLDVIVWEADASTWEFLYVSPQAEEILGYPSQKWLADPNFWISTIHPDDREEAVAYCERCTQEGRPHEIEYRALTPDNEVVWIRDIVNVVTGEEGQPVKLSGVMVDITERKRTEEALRESEQQLREQTQTLETINQAGITLAAELDLKNLVQAVTDAGTEISGAEFGAFFYNEVNEKGERYTLYTLSGAPKEAFEDFPHPRNTEIFGPTFRGEETVRLDDVTDDPRYGNNPPYNGMPEGHLPVHSYLAVPVVSNSGEVLGGLFFGHGQPGVFTEQDENIIAGIAAQAAIAIDNARLYEKARENEERFRAVAENAVDIIATIDREMRIQYVSPSVEEILGYRPEDLTGAQLTDYVHPHDTHQARNEIIAITLVPEEVGSFTLRFKREDGTIRHLSIKVRNMQERPGVEGLLLNIRDVTEVKQYEEKLIDAKEQAEEMTRVKSNLLANMSHEIRTPLTGILGLAEGLESKVSENQREEVRLIEKSGQRLMDTLNSVISLAQLEGDELEISREFIVVSEEVREIAQSLEHLAVEKGLDFEVRSDIPNVKARMDATLLGRILSNLVTNAIKFTEEGKIAIQVSATDDEVAISVSDTGVGISEEFKPHLFEEFKQESTGLARSHEGIGLGLVLTKKMVDLLDGDISLTSQKGEGSTFTVTFPRVSEPSPREEKEPEAEKSGRPAEEKETETATETKTETAILLVEDNDIIRRVIVDRLEKKEGYKVESFAEAEPALERAEERTFDIVLMDISLPGIDGIEALGRLRATKRYAERPILAITGHALPGDRERFLEEGFSEYMAKPFSADELTETIRSLPE